MNKINIVEMHTLLEKLLVAGGEQSWLEFKSNIGKQNASITPEGVGEYISALSNGACIAHKEFGYLVLGIDDKDFTVKGTNLKPTEYKIGNQDFELWLRTLINPKIKFEIFQFDYSGKNIVLFRIPSAKGEPVYFQKKPYIRINSQKTELHNFPSYLREIYNSMEDWSANIVEQASISDLDSQALKVARAKFKEKSVNENWYNEIDSWDDITLLNKARITINGKITNTALILLGKPESGHFLLPSVCEISWKLETDEVAYQHFSIPMLLNTTHVLNRIRNVKYKFFPHNQLIATEVNKYESRVILEALHNAIAHQDYSANARITVVEKTDKLIFSNSGGFFDGVPDDYITGERIPEKYRNTWLSRAMLNLNMIDTMGFGVHTMYIEQRKRFFPMPDYSRSTSEKVVLEIYGHAIDQNYSLLLMEQTGLDLTTIVLLDKIQKKMPLTPDEIVRLKKQRLIEGRKPNYQVTAKIAERTDVKSDYIKNKGFDDQYFKDLIIEYLKKFKEASKSDIYKLIYGKLPDILAESQKQNKIRNIMYSMSKREHTIRNEGTQRYPKWKLVLDKLRQT
ncbi:MAG TPA: putative DNA binding domain-containing protein [Ignavibacteriaceae bacterium]|nr:putative DNA binding domain-containing protein [Ignavibacteriaceae bacterium]